MRTGIGAAAPPESPVRKLGTREFGIRQAHEPGQAAGGQHGLAPERPDRGTVEAMLPAGPARAGEPFRRPRPGAEPAMHAAAAVLHGRLPAATA